MRRLLLTLVLAMGCGLAPKEPGLNYTADEVLLVGEDVVLRTEHDGTIPAITTRVLDE